MLSSSISFWRMRREVRFMSTDANKPLARRWFDSASYRDKLRRALESRDPGPVQERFFRALIAQIFSADCIMHFPDSDGDFSRILRYHMVMTDAFPDPSL